MLALGLWVMQVLLSFTHAIFKKEDVAEVLEEGEAEGVAEVLEEVRLLKKALAPEEALKEAWFKRKHSCNPF